MTNNNKIKVLQTLVIDDSTLIFTEYPENDIEEIVRMYHDENRTGYMGYERPVLVEWEFLGNKYKAISFWHDNEDVRDIDFN